MTACSSLTARARDIMKLTRDQALPASGSKKMTERAYAGPNLYALLIGIDCYLPNERSGTPNRINLSGCVRDINRVEEFLRAGVGLSESRVLKLTAADDGSGRPVGPTENWPTRENIIGAFRRLGELAAPGDHVYIHYSGHGGRVKTPPRLQHIKGGAGFDEALVPADYNFREDKFLRDFELSYILRGYVERELVVTVVLDSCHSGGATHGGGRRGLRQKNGTAVRSLGIIGDVFPPPESPVAPDEELAASWHERSRAPARDLDVGSSWLIEPKGYVLLAACRPSEYAYEHAFDGAEQTGVLTYWLLDSLRSLGVRVTFKTLYDRVLAKVHSRFPNQTPQLQGECDRVIFASAKVRPPQGVAVLQVAAAKGEVVLNVGQAQGVSRGALFAVYPRGETDFARVERRRALVSITAPDATESRAVIMARLGGGLIEQGDHAVLLAPGAAKVWRTLRLVPGDGDSDGSPRLDALREVEHALRRRADGLVRAAPDGASADFLVSVGEGDEYVVSDAGGSALRNLRPQLRIGEPGAPARVVERLVHLTKYLNVCELDNCDPYSPLPRQVSVELLGVQAEYVLGERPAPRPFEQGAGVPTVKTGEWTFLKILNNSPQVLNVTALDLRPDWSIRQIYPSGAAFYEPLDPGHHLTLPLRAGLPHGYSEGRDVIKVFATVGASNFRWLELPPTDTPQEAGNVRRGEPTSRLEEFLTTFMYGGTFSRDLGVETAAGREWATIQVEINVRRG